ncbi:MAG: DNA polymerase III subunit gamma/tau [Lachnospiraceae bacterium]
MSYTALYRKFRPLTFDDVKGQDHIVTTLKNQMKAGRIGHAYLFTGTRGTGKTSVAKIFAKAVNCEHLVDGEACGTCAMCAAISAGVSMNVIEIDAASNNGIDNIRDIVDEVAYSPTEGKYKVYIIDEVHMLSIGAFNALLKTLEEPPSYVIFILATTEVHKIPITILSRCQRYDFKRITIDSITARLQELLDAEGIEAQKRAVRYIAKLADGSLRDGISLLDQCIAFHLGETLTFDKVLDVLGAVDTKVFSDILRALLHADVVESIELLEEIIMQGRELQQLVVDMTWYLRNLLILKTAEVNSQGNMNDLEKIMEVSSDNLIRLKEEAGLIDMVTLLRFIRIFSELTSQLKFTSNKRVMIELTFIKLCRPEMEIDTEALHERVRFVEKKLEEGVVLQQVSASEQGQIVERPKLPVALAEEITEVIQNFQAYKKRMPKLMEIHLKQAQLSVSEQGHLVIGISDGTDSDYFVTFPENQIILAELLADEVGKDIPIQIIPIVKKADFDSKYPDTSSLICMDMLEEDDE